MRRFFAIVGLICWVNHIAIAALPQSWYSSVPTNENLMAVTYGQGQLIVVGWYNTILRSTDGFAWTQAGTGSADPFYSAAYGNRIFVAGGQVGHLVSISPDGVNWTNLHFAVLQVTDIKSNHNKYYALELHAAAKAHAKGAPTYRLFTHYGRTDDLDTDPDSGQKECRYFESLDAARCGYQSIYSEKTSPRKGYREIALASCCSHRRASGLAVASAARTLIATVRPSRVSLAR